MRSPKSRASVLALAVFAVALVFGTVQTASAERTIALSTGTVDLALAQGGQAEDRIMVANNGDEPLKAMVYASDVTYNKDGSPKYVKPAGTPGEILRSPASWLTLRLPTDTQVVANTPYIELKPGEEVELRFEMNVPTQATPGDYNSVIFFELFDMDEGDAGASSKVSGRIGSRIRVRVAGDVIDKLELAPYGVRNLVIGDLVPYAFTLTNNGNIDKRFVPSLVVLDTNEAERMRSQIESNAIVYARNARDYKGTLKLDKNASFGKYIVRAEMAYDKETGTQAGATVPEKLTKDREIFVVPLWLAIALVLLIAVPILWLIWRVTAGRKRKEPVAVAEAPSSPAPSEGETDQSA